MLYGDEMNAQASRIEPDYAHDLRQIFLAKIQAREIRRRQFRYLAAMALALAGWMIVACVLVGGVLMFVARLK